MFYTKIQQEIIKDPEKWYRQKGEDCVYLTDTVIRVKVPAERCYINITKLKKTDPKTLDVARKFDLKFGYDQLERTGDMFNFPLIKTVAVKLAGKSSGIYWINQKYLNKVAKFSVVGNDDCIVRIDAGGEGIARIMIMKGKLLDGR